MNTLHESSVPVHSGGPALQQSPSGSQLGSGSQSMCREANPFGSRETHTRLQDYNFNSPFDFPNPPNKRVEDVRSQVLVGQKASVKIGSDTTNFTNCIPPSYVPSTQKEWHQQVTNNLRQQQIENIFLALLPVDPEKHMEGIIFARKMERDIFESADGIEEYFNFIEYTQMCAKRLPSESGKLRSHPQSIGNNLNSMMDLVERSGSPNDAAPSSALILTASNSQDGLRNKIIEQEEVMDGTMNLECSGTGCDSDSESVADTDLNLSTEDLPPLLSPFRADTLSNDEEAMENAYMGSHQISGVFSFPQPEYPAIPKEWHLYAPKEMRVHWTRKLYSIFPCSNRSGMKNLDLLNYARKTEKEIFESADDREEYHYLLFEKISKIEKKKNERKLHRSVRKEKQLQKEQLQQLQEQIDYLQNMQQKHQMHLQHQQQEQEDQRHLQMINREQQQQLQIDLLKQQQEQHELQHQQQMKQADQKVVQEMQEKQIQLQQQQLQQLRQQEHEERLQHRNKEEKHQEVLEKVLKEQGDQQKQIQELLRLQLCQELNLEQQQQKQKEILQELMNVVSNSRQEQQLQQQQLERFEERQQQQNDELLQQQKDQKEQQEEIVRELQSQMQGEKQNHNQAPKQNQQEQKNGNATDQNRPVSEPNVLLNLHPAVLLIIITFFIAKLLSIFCNY